MDAGFHQTLVDPEETRNVDSRLEQTRDLDDQSTKGMDSDDAHSVGPTRAAHHASEGAAVGEPSEHHLALELSKNNDFAAQDSSHEGQRFFEVVNPESASLVYKALRWGFVYQQQ